MHRHSCYEAGAYSDCSALDDPRLVIAGDALVLLVTWIKTFRQWYQSRELGMRLSVTSCLLRDGMDSVSRILIEP